MPVDGTGVVGPAVVADPVDGQPPPDRLDARLAEIALPIEMGKRNGILVEDEIASPTRPPVQGFATESELSDRCFKIREASVPGVRGESRVGQFPFGAAIDDFAIPGCDVISVMSLGEDPRIDEEAERTLVAPNASPPPPRKTPGRCRLRSEAPFRTMVSTTGGCPRCPDSSLSQCARPVLPLRCQSAIPPRPTPAAYARNPARRPPAPSASKADQAPAVRRSRRTRRQGPPIGT